MTQATKRTFTQEQSAAMYSLLCTITDPDFISQFRHDDSEALTWVDLELSKILEMNPATYAFTKISAIDSTPQPDTNQGARYVVEGDFRGMFTIRDLDDYSFLDAEYTDEAVAQAACDRLNASTPAAGSGNGGS